MIQNNVFGLQELPYGKKKLFFEAGKFDKYFFTQEEIDLCWRLQAMGFQIWVEPML